MDLKLCPACGQSVLDDDAKVCPFCGAAMDGSDKGSRKPSGTKPAAPRPAAAGSGGTATGSGNTASKSPGAGKSVSGAAKPPSGAAGAAKSESKPIQAGLRAGKPQVDEDDPFGLGTVGPSANVIQALEKPEKGHLHRVICPMCEKPGFVSKSAIGKQVRCANPKCMVPVFTVPDPDAPAADRIPKRRAMSEDKAGDGAGSVKPRSPMMIYGIVGGVLLVLAVVFVQFLNRGPKIPSDLSKPVEIPVGGYGNTDAEAEALAAEEKAKAAQAASQNNTAAEADRLVRRMITTARVSANRDKAFARRLTADVYFRLNQPALGAQEFSQLLLVNRQSAFYQIEPRLTVYWKKKAAGDAAGAKAELDQILKDSATIPNSGRIALESAMGVASALMAEGRAAEATQLIQKNQRDRSVSLNRDAMSSAAWFFTASSLRSSGKPAIAVTDVFSWYDPLRTAVAVDLAIRSRFREALAWSTASTEKREVTDSLAAVAELAAAGSSSDADLSALETAAAAVHPMALLRIQSVIAAERKSTQRLQAVAPAVAAIQTQPPLAVPSIDKVLRMDLPDGFAQRMTAAALTDYARAAVLCGDVAGAEEGLRKLTAILFEIAPPAAETRAAVLEVEQREADVKRRINSDLRITSETEVASTFRNYRRKVDQIAVVAEERRLSLIQKLARVVRAGGVEPVRTVLNDPALGLKQEVLVDELAGLLAAAATRTGQSMPELEALDPALKVQLPDRTKELHEISVGPLAVNAWILVKQGRVPQAMKLISGGSTDLPGLREAVLSEIVHYTATNAQSSELVYTGIGAISNPVWREEALQTAGRIFALRGMEKASETWIDAQNRMPPTEQVTAFYGLAIGLIERGDAPAETKSTTPGQK